MEKRYQIFISSTFADLKEERKEIIESVLNLRHIPAGMEMFSASNDEQFKYIKKIIDNCDYYVLIIGARYGSINPNSGISYTEQEYDYAISKNIPVLAFIHNDPYNLPTEKREDDKREQLNNFRKKVEENRMCRMWNTTSELVSSVVISLTEEMSENPQQGWVRGGTYDNTGLLEQLNDLRIKNEKLVKEIKKLDKEIHANNYKVEDLACGNDKYTIKGKVYDGPKRHHSSYSFRLSWDEIFSAIGPYLIPAIHYTAFSKYLRDSINSAHNTSFSSLNNDCIQTIKIQLNALGLIDARPVQSSGGAMAEFITLTKSGRNYLLRLKSIKKSEDKDLDKDS